MAGHDHGAGPPRAYIITEAKPVEFWASKVRRGLISLSNRAFFTGTPIVKLGFAFPSAYYGQSRQEKSTSRLCVLRLVGTIMHFD
jgi:hypothetical protein